MALLGFELQRFELQLRQSKHSTMLLTTRLTTG